MQHLTTGTVKAEVEITATDGATVPSGENRCQWQTLAVGHRQASVLYGITCRKGLRPGQRSP